MIFIPNKFEVFLLDILRGEVLGRKAQEKRLLLSVSELTQVMRVAKEHTVQGLVANAAVQGSIEISADSGDGKQRAVMKLIQVNMMHQRNYLRFSKAIADFTVVMNKYGLRFVIFKGVAMARRYPVPYARTMGDVDFYVPASDFDKAVVMIERELHVEIEKENIDKHYCFDYQGIRFEMHYQIETFGNGSHQRYFNRMIDESIGNGADCFSISVSGNDGGKVQVSVLPSTEDLIVVFKHWFNHLLVEGVGLRQTIDLAILLKAYQDRVDAARLMVSLDKIGYMKAFRAMLAMMRKYFGLSQVENFCVLNGQDEKYADKLMETIMESGNFGRKAYKNHTKGKEKSMETATRALRHCMKFFWLAPLDILCLIPKRIEITLRQRI